MACEFLYNPVQEVALNAPILFDTSIPCSRGNVYHEGNTGNFILRGANSGSPCTSTAIIKVPKGCCFSLSVEAVPASTDPTVTPAPVIEVQNANLTIARIA